MGIKVVECLDWPARDRPGELLKLGQQLKKAGVDLDALWAYHSPRGEPKVAAIAKRPAKLRAALKAMGIKAARSQCFYVTGKDRAGAHLELLGALAAAKINVDVMDGLSVGGRYAATFWVNDLQRAKRVLKVR